MRTLGVGFLILVMGVVMFVNGQHRPSPAVLQIQEENRTNLRLRQERIAMCSTVALEWRFDCTYPDK